MAVNAIRIFISSPSDVSDERQKAGKVVERLQGKYWSFVRLDDVLWEKEAVRATAHYQDELINPGNCEIVVGVFWSRLGSPLPAKFQKQVSSSPITGTEWELEQAFGAYERRKRELVTDGTALRQAEVLAKPDILIYRRNTRRPTQPNPEEDEEAGCQEAALNAYLEANYFFDDANHTIRRPIAYYLTLDQFEAKLSVDLEQLVLRMIPGLKPGFEPPPISGSPFKELQAFNFSDNDR